MVIIVGLGFGVLFEQYPFVHHIIKVLGITYLLYLSLQQEKYQRRFNVTMALLLVLSIVPVLLEYIN
ncbi:hypothetical protein A9Q98_00370 [Thalassotalea sp. 42_200_T64]|nr:hypothetical protein A9Q98_00370 [Thalassotalea sp. 42_200_T64]